MDKGSYNLGDACHKSSPSIIHVVKTKALVLLTALGLVAFYFAPFRLLNPHPPPSTQLDHLSSHCAHIPPISPSEFVDRQTSLAQTLRSLNASAYVAEPGASAQFYGNISDSRWHLSERPLLLIITPNHDTSTGHVQSKVTILTPKFESTRAKLLNIPSASGVDFVEWAEEADPYTIAVSSVLDSLTEGGAIFVDGSVRNFIAEGLRTAAPHFSVKPAPVEVRRLRERKSPSELEILKCANEVTLLAIRATREQMYIGMRESEGRTMIRGALAKAGLEDLDSIVLFGENAALPHGSGTDRVLGESDLILIDCGGSLHGYHSDVTRTFALRSSFIPSAHLSLWKLVQDAQTSAHVTATSGTLTRTVDEVAREVILAQGYGQYFTHRLGHGIGLEGHESPYLRGGSDDIIQTGHTFSNEPGIYIEGKVGIRLEDCFYISEESGNAVYLTEGVGGPSRSPWFP
ncbi:hypothetical protein JAAARDRAFT_31632 [Jaapia argillacea MUCL 33604]|uniref:Peptidase M24 domain-containing protein n=1 Tax=Jaapia argillacea MUCL 33604 TaxID=933084 RepID=A0A067Q112_9AGAM|nr:hypothetical protein JAAARDRAFT_31632 [Jaapia argillacea MUCL 33604]